MIVERGFAFAAPLFGCPELAHLCYNEAEYNEKGGFDEYLTDYVLSMASLFFLDGHLEDTAASRGIWPRRPGLFPQIGRAHV